jgi:hypothetical protein
MGQTGDIGNGKGTSETGTYNAHCGLDVAHAHPGRADQREDQAEAGQGDSAEDGPGQEEPVPADRDGQEQRGVGEFRCRRQSADQSLVWSPTGFGTPQDHEEADEANEHKRRA